MEAHVQDKDPSLPTRLGVNQAATSHIRIPLRVRFLRMPEPRSVEIQSDSCKDWSKGGSHHQILAAVKWDWVTGRGQGTLGASNVLPFSTKCENT